MPHFCFLFILFFIVCAEWTWQSAADHADEQRTRREQAEATHAAMRGLTHMHLVHSEASTGLLPCNVLPCYHVTH